MYLSAVHLVCSVYSVGWYWQAAWLDVRLKVELNLDKKWQSDDLFYIIMSEIHPRFQPILSNFKDILIYFKNLKIYLLLNIAKIA